MDSPVIYQVGGGLIILFFLVLTYFFTKTWRAAHVVFAFLTFGVAIWLVVMASLTHKTHLTWRKQYDQLKDKLTALESEIEVLTYGEQRDAQGNMPESVLGLRGKLNRVLIDRGRVWRRCQSAPPAANGSVTVNTGGENPATATPNRIAENSVMYVYQEADVDGAMVPMFYLGEFRVAAVTDTSVTLTSTDVRLLLPDQIQMIRQPQSTWVLYEMLPLDSHMIYARDPHNLQPLTEVEGEPVFGQMDTELVEQLYQNHKPATLKEDIKRDGSKAKPGDSPDNVFVKVEFLQAHSVQVSNNQPQGALNANYFDGSGLSTVQRLQREDKDGDGNPDEVKFAVGDIGVFDQQQANQLVDQNVCKPIEPIFVRTLRDFNYDYHELLNRSIKLAQDYGEEERNRQATNAAHELSKKQRDYRAVEKGKLVQDKVRFDNEQTLVAQYLGELQQKQKRLIGELSALYRSNANMVAQLAARNKQLTDEANRRTAEATAQAQP